MKHLFLTCVATLFISQVCAAQNLLVDGDFEATAQPHIGDNIVPMPNQWVSTIYPLSGNSTSAVDYSVVRIDGPNGTLPTAAPSMSGGNAVLQALPRVDASGSTSGQYMRLNLGTNTGHYIGQRITVPRDGCIEFGASFATTHPMGLTTSLFVNSLDPTAFAAITTPPALNERNIHYALNGWIAAEHFNQLNVSADWTPLSVHFNADAGTPYVLALNAVDLHAIDNVSARYVSAQHCDPSWTPPSLTPQDVTLFKSCALEGAHTHNGILGQRWVCQVDVTTTSTPFAGDIILHDLFTDTPLVAGEILLGESVSGNGSCFGGDCLISGADFDNSGSESFTFDVFVEAVGEADVYPLENCITGEIDDGSGTMQPLTPYCTAGQWIPRSDVVKTCDPIPENATAPYTMNCQIDVTASGLAAGSYVSVMDAFAAQPPSTATVTPTFMNVISTENWACIDHAINTPSSIGICELSAEDLMAAGGTSTLDISFQFDVDQAPTQVANCRFTDIHTSSYLNKLNSQRSALRSPIQSGQGQNAGWPQMPDGCVYVDVPGPQLETKVETKITKDCDQPHLTSINGTLGYLWQCEAEVEVSPSPFAGDVSFTDDGSQISIGTSEFVSVSDPNNCQGIGTDTLDCSFDGTTFSSPHHVQYDLFTPYIQTDEEIEWKNCIQGAAETPAGTFPSVPMCTGRFIKPTDVPVFDPLKEIKLEKVCKDEVREMEHDGEMGLGWDCQINVTASPAPFAGSFTFTEDASAITGSNGQIVAIDQSQPAHWNCTPNVPTSATDCTISGTDFDASGTETLGFTLFAPNSEEPGSWKNCVSGVYNQGDDIEPRKVEGNCEEIKWEPPIVSEPPEFSLKKSCQGPFDQGDDGQSYTCSIAITHAGGAITQPLTLNELFSSTTTGQPATQFLVSLLGSAGWNCDMPTASCTTQPGAFNGQTGHQIAGTFLIPNGTLAEQDFENCASLAMGDVEVATAPCVDIDEPNGDPAFDVKKECKPLGDRQVMGPTAWFQSWSCTITVASNGVPFTGPLWINEDMLYGPHNGSQSVVAVTSNDPWQCSPAPYGPNGNQPTCGIQGNQFPHNTSTLDVTLNIFGGAADQFGAQNCVTVNMGQTPATDPANVIAEDCIEIIPAPGPQEPQIDLVKTCEPATQNGTGQWTVDCTLTITGQNLPNGQQFRVTDELMSSSTQTATFGTMNAGTNACGGGPIAGGTMAGCDLTTDMINNNGGTLTIPYTGTYQGPAGRPLNGPQAQNCAFVDIPSLGLHGPSDGNGKSCVSIEFKASISSGVSDIVIDPEVPDGGSPDVGGVDVTNPPLDATGVANPLVTTPLVPTITKTCDPLIFAAGAQTATANCHISISVPNGSQIEVTRLADVATPLNSSSYIVQGPADLLTGAPDLNCIEMTNAGGGTAAFCAGPGVTSLSRGGQANLGWTAELVRPRDPDAQYQNCAQLTYRATPNGPLQAANTCHVFEMSLDEGKQPEAGASPAPMPAPLLEHTLKTRKFQTSDCVPNRNTQRYSCGFQITVTNEGNAPFNGPLVVTDTFGSPYAQAITQTSGGGWSCAQPVAGSVSCEHSGLNLPAGSFAYIDLEMEVQGLVNGGQWENCAAVGIPNDRKQRVAAIQQVMNARGFAAGPVDGLPGKKTYAALAEMQKSLGLPVSRELNDALLAALGLPLAKPGGKACVIAKLPPMPKPPLQCERATTVQKGESCQCRYGNMIRRNATACQCKGGYAFVAGEGCVKQVVTPKPEPTPPPLLETRTCDKRSTRLRGDECVCLDQRNAVKASKTTCRCKNGGPMIGGKCLPITITPKPSKPDATDDPVGTTEPEMCKIRMNGICIK